MKNFEIVDTGFKNLKILVKKPHRDKRGFFQRIYCDNELQPFLDGQTIKQVNHAYTNRKATIRGLHFQYPPFEEMKIVSCIKGAVLDVVVDIRRTSNTYLNHFAIELNASNNKSLIIPSGFAHGFQALEDDCEFLYLNTASYNPSAEGGLNALDPALGIKWTLPAGERSDKDQAWKHISSSFE